jgi:hypothetical protein
MNYMLKAANVTSYPILSLEFTDGFVGELDLTNEIETGPMFAPLKDRDFFNRVALSDGGRIFGWRLDEIGQEIDFDASAARIDIETAMTAKAASNYRSHRTAAE